MSLLARLRSRFFAKPVQPAGDPAQLSELRSGAYRELFGSEPVRVFPHDLFQKPPLGGRVDVLLYQLPYQRRHGQVQVAVTSGMSDYRMTLPGERAAGAARRRELVQYFRECRISDVARLHDMAWLPLAQRFCLDFFETAGPYPDSDWPNSLFVPPLPVSHAEFRLPVGEGEEMRLMWHVPLSEEELAFKATLGLAALLERMEERNLPWVFDANERPSLI